MAFLAFDGVSNTLDFAQAGVANVFDAVGVATSRLGFFLSRYWEHFENPTARGTLAMIYGSQLWDQVSIQRQVANGKILALDQRWRLNPLDILHLLYFRAQNIHAHYVPTRVSLNIGWEPYPIFDFSASEVKNDAE